MKKLAAVFMVLTMIFTVSACQKDEDKTVEVKLEEAKEDVKEDKKAEVKEEKKENSVDEAKKLSLEDFATALKEDGTLIVDTRPSNNYIGWPGDGSNRGGHLEGAIDFSAQWIDSPYDDKENLEGETREQVLDEALSNKGMTVDKKIVLYDAGGDYAKTVYKFLAGKGFKNLAIVDASDWINGDKELITYPNYKLLLSPEIVHSYIESGKAETLDENIKYKVLNVNWGEVDQSGYLDGHVPGAIHINTDWFEPPSDNGWMLASDDVLKELVLKLGISANDGIIVTGPEPMAAARFATILDYLGVKDVRVMNGALIGWQLAGYKLDTEEVKPEPIDDFGAALPVNPDRIDTQDETAKKLEDNDNYILIDNRTIEEFEGKTSGYSYHDKAGRIEGAVFGYAGKKNSSSMSYYRNIDKSMRNGYEIEKMLKDAGIDTNKQMATMCGSGWRAAEVLWYLRVMGYENTSLYSDGWIGWSNSGRPVAE